MILSSSLLKCYSLEKSPKRKRIVGETEKPFETVIENCKEFEELMLSLYLIDRYLPNETGLSFETRWPAVWQEKKELIENLFEFLTHRKLSILFVTPPNPTFIRQERITCTNANNKQDSVVSLFSGGPRQHCLRT